MPPLSLDYYHCPVLSVSKSVTVPFCDLTDVTLACEDHTTSLKVMQPLIALHNLAKPNPLLKLGPNFEAKVLSQM